MTLRARLLRLLAGLGVLAVILPAAFATVLPALHRWGATDAEVARALPGDELLPHPAVSWTRRLADTVETRPLPSLGWGVIAFFAFLAAVITILAVTIALAILLGYLTLGGLVGMIL